MLGGMDVCGLMEKLIHVPHIIGAKYTMPDYYLMHRLSELNGGDINIINGPDETLLCGLIMGADGGIGTTYNLIPDYYVHIYDAYKAGDIEEAKSGSSKPIGLSKYLFATVLTERLERLKKRLPLWDSMPVMRQLLQSRCSKRMSAH